MPNKINPLDKYKKSEENPLAKYNKSESNPLAKYAPKKETAIDRIKEHPFKSVFTPAATTLTGESLQERALEATKPTYIKPESKLDYAAKFAKMALSGMGGSVADIATTPASYIPLPIGKLLGKIPLGKTTLGKVAKTVPFKRLGNVAGLSDEVALQETLKKLPSRVAGSQQVLQKAFTKAPVALGKRKDPVQTIMKALKEAGPIREAQEDIFSVERASRFKKAGEIGKELKGVETFQKKLGAMGGELSKTQFEGIRNKVTENDITQLMNQIELSPLLDEGQKLTAQNGFMRLIGEAGGGVPRRSELAELGKVFPEEFITTILDKRPMLEMVGEGLTEVLNVPRAIMASFDMSAPFRQGVFLINRPKQFIPAFGKMFKYFFNEKSYQGLLDDIKARPTYDLMQKGGLSITTHGKVLSNREEAFMSNLAEKIPLGVGKTIKASNRAYSGFLDKLRADTFDSMVSSFESQGAKVEGKLLKDLTGFINNATGRGKLPFGLDHMSAALNSGFFSPKLMASRLNLMNPSYYTQLSPMVRKEALSSLLTFSGVASTVLGLAKANGAEVELDPRSADFAKIKVGNTRYDILGGFQQYIRLIAQMTTGKHISSTTGVTTTVGEGYKPLNRLQIAGRFLRSKAAPVPSLGLSLLSGTGFGGTELDIPKEVMSRFVPLVLQDIQEITKEHGKIKGIGMTIPGFFGTGVQTYEMTGDDAVRSSRSAVTFAKKLFRQGRTQEGREMLQDNKDVIDIGKRLYGYSDKINELEKARDNAIKNARLSKDERFKRISIYDYNINQLQNEMDKRMEDLRKQPQR